MQSAFVTLVLVAALAGAGTPRARAQSPSDDEQTVRQAVETFLKDLGALDYHRVAAAMTSKALVVISRQRDGAFVPTVLTRDDWLASLWANGTAARFEEPLSNVRVTVESGHLGHLRADFQVIRDGTVLSSGVDHFVLVRDADAWKIAAIAFTSIPTAKPVRGGS